MKHSNLYAYTLFAVFAAAAPLLVYLSSLVLTTSELLLVGCLSFVMFSGAVTALPMVAAGACYQANRTVCWSSYLAALVIFWGGY